MVVNTVDSGNWCNNFEATIHDGLTSLNFFACNLEFNLFYMHHIFSEFIQIHNTLLLSVLKKKTFKSKQNEICSKILEQDINSEEKFQSMVIF